MSKLIVEAPKGIIMYNRLPSLQRISQCSKSQMRIFKAKPIKIYYEELQKLFTRYIFLFYLCFYAKLCLSYLSINIVSILPQYANSVMDFRLSCSSV